MCNHIKQCSLTQISSFCIKTHNLYNKCVAATPGAAAASILSYNLELLGLFREAERQKEIEIEKDIEKQIDRDREKEEESEKDKERQIDRQSKT